MPGIGLTTAALAVLGAASVACASAGSAKLGTSGLPRPVPAVAEYQFLSASATPPAESDCFSVGRRCFTPLSMQNSYNLTPLYAAGNEGQGGHDRDH